MDAVEFENYLKEQYELWNMFTLGINRVFKNLDLDYSTKNIIDEAFKALNCTKNSFTEKGYDYHNSTIYSLVCAYVYKVINIAEANAGKFADRISPSFLKEGLISYYIRRGLCKRNMDSFETYECCLTELENFDFDSSIDNALMNFFIDYYQSEEFDEETSKEIIKSVIYEFMKLDMNEHNINLMKIINKAAQNKKRIKK